MEYCNKTREELAEDVARLRKRIEELEQAVRSGKTEKTLDRHLDHNRLWQETFDVVDDLMYIVDREFKIVRANKATFDTFAPEEMLGKKCFHLFHHLNNPANHCPACKVFHSGKSCHIERQESSLQNRWFSISAYPIKDDHGFVWQCLVVHRDITDCRNMMNKLNELEIKDGLTGLINRRHFIEVLAREFRLAARRGSGLVFMLFTIDKFKEINSSCGRKFGDFLLKEISAILVNHVRKTDICGRIGADEFGVLLPDADPVEGQIIARNLHAQMRQFVFDDGEIGRQISISVGVAANNAVNLQNHEDFFSLVDKALHVAKSEGGNKVVLLTESDVQGSGIDPG